ncbi:MAG: hypothetical protein PUE32_01615, partial [Clostridia bacterium]|nr:hypothetical protein [Clostridia bacterium]
SCRNPRIPILCIVGCMCVWLVTGPRAAEPVNAIGTLEEITSGGVCWITLRQQWGNCLKPVGLSFEPLLK